MQGRRILGLFSLQLSLSSLRSTTRGLFGRPICSFIKHEDDPFYFPQPRLTDRVSALVHSFLPVQLLSTQRMSALDGVNGTACNAEQYQRSLPSQENPVPSISCLTHGQTIGLTVRIRPRLLFSRSPCIQLTVQISFLSLISVIAIYTWIAVSPTLRHYLASFLMRCCVVEFSMVQEKRPACVLGVV